MSEAQRARLYHRTQLAGHAMQKHSDRVMQAATGMTTAQVAVMSVLVNGGLVTQRHVAHELGVNESAVTGMVQRLEQSGCVRRCSSAEDRRVRLLELTDSGRAVLSKARAVFATINAVIEATLSPTEIEMMASTLTRLTDAFTSAYQEDLS